MKPAKITAYFISLLLASGLLNIINAAEPEVIIHKLTDNIYRLECINGNSVNSTALIGPDGVLLIDTGRKKTAEQLSKAIDSISDGSIEYIINTHLHGDHTGGNETLGKEATIIAHEFTSNKLLKEYESDSTLPPGLPNKTVADSMQLKFNGEDIRIIHISDGHTGGDLIVHFVNSKIVCTGDQLFSDKFPFIDLRNGGSIDIYLANIDKIAGMFPRDITFVAGHGREYKTAELENYRQKLTLSIEIVRNEFKAGKSLDQVFETGVLANWKSWGENNFVSDSAWIMIIQQDMASEE